MSIDLTVLLVIGERRDRAVDCLRSVLAQDAIGRMEVLILDCAPGDPPPLPGSEHPAVRAVKLPPDTLFSAAKTLGVRTASAPVVAFVEEHCRVHPGWAEALIAAHQGPWAGVGAEVHNGNPGVAVSRRIAFLNYHPWMPPAPRAEFDMLPGHNSSFKREVLLSYGDDLEELLRAEIVLHQRLHRDGHRLLLEPRARFSHINESTFASAARGRFLWNRCYAPLRARTFGWSRGRRLFYVAATPLIPFYSLVRIFLSLARRDPRTLPAALASAPFLWALQLVSVVGHSMGLLFGAGDAEAHFSLYEMNEPRELGEGEA